MNKTSEVSIFKENKSIQLHFNKHIYILINRHRILNLIMVKYTLYKQITIILMREIGFLLLDWDDSDI